MTDELKPVKCGCGGEARTGKIYGDAWTVECTECGIQSGCYDTESEAVTAWNRAMSGNMQNLHDGAERTAKVKVLYKDESVIFGHCECGQAVNTYSTYCCKCGARLEWE